MGKCLYFEKYAHVLQLNGIVSIFTANLRQSSSTNDKAHLKAGSEGISKSVVCTHKTRNFKFQEVKSVGVSSSVTTTNCSQYRDHWIILHTGSRIHRIMAHSVGFSILKELKMKQYKDAFAENFLTDDVMQSVLKAVVLVDNFKEIMPPLGHRLLFLSKLTAKFNNGNIIVNTDLEEFEVLEPESEQIAMDRNQVNCTHCFTSIKKDWNSIWNHLRHNHMMSTDQRQQLAERIVDQLFSYMSDAEKCDLKLSYFTPSSSYKDQNGKSVSKRPIGYIQSFFYNFWQRNGPKQKIFTEVPFEDILSDPITEEEYLKIIDWLKSNRGPPQKVFEKLNQSYASRTKFLSSAKSFSDVISTCPRLFDIDGAIQNDFSTAYSMVSDNLSFYWKNVSTEIVKYENILKRQASILGILLEVIQTRVEQAAFFLLPFLIRARNKKVSQANSVDAFIKVVARTDEIGEILTNKSDCIPQVLVVGNKQRLEFEESFVVFDGKLVKCATLLEAVDLAFKSFYVFKIEFPPDCFGAYQFLDYAVFKMKIVCPVMSNVKELAAYVCKS